MGAIPTTIAPNATESVSGPLRRKRSGSGGEPITPAVEDGRNVATEASYLASLLWDLTGLLGHLSALLDLLAARRELLDCLCSLWEYRGTLLTVRMGMAATLLCTVLGRSEERLREFGRVGRGPRCDGQ